MPIKKKQGESKNDFINRCVGIEVCSGKRASQAVAICNTYWDEISLKEMQKRRKYQKSETFHRLSTFEKVSGEDFTRYGLTMEDLMNPKNQNGVVNDDELTLNFADIPKGYEVRYKYISGEAGHKAEREFCKDMTQGMYKDKWWSRSEIETLNNAPGKVDFVTNKGRKPGTPANTRGYSVFNWRGGNNCKHIWVRYIFKVDESVEGPQFLETNVQPLQKSTKPQ